MEENPAFDGGDGVDGEVDIEAAVKAGTITAEQVNATLQAPALNTWQPWYSRLAGS